MRVKNLAFLCIFPIDICASRRQVSEARTSIIPYPQQFVNRQFQQILKKYLSRNCAFSTNRKKIKKTFKKPIDRFAFWVYNISVLRERTKSKGCESQLQSDKKNKKTFQKPLDKSLNLWYNINVKRATQKNLKSPSRKELIL